MYSLIPYKENKKIKTMFHVPHRVLIKCSNDTDPGASARKSRLSKTGHHFDNLLQALNVKTL